MTATKTLGLRQACWVPGTGNCRARTPRSPQAKVWPILLQVFHPSIPRATMVTHRGPRCALSAREAREPAGSVGSNFSLEQTEGLACQPRGLGLTKRKPRWP